LTPKTLPNLSGLKGEISKVPLEFLKNFKLLSTPSKMKLKPSSLHWLYFRKKFV